MLHRGEKPLPRAVPAGPDVIDPRAAAGTGRGGPGVDASPVLPHEQGSRRGKTEDLGDDVEEEWDRGGGVREPEDCPPAKTMNIARRNRQSTFDRGPWGRT